MLGAALTAGVLVGGPLAVHIAHAAIGCRGDPIGTLSNGVTLQISKDIGADAFQVSAIAYVVHAPAGTQLLSVTYTAGVIEAMHRFISCSSGSGSKEIRTMPSDHPPITAGMAVRDATEQSVGQVQDVGETTVVVRMRRDLVVPVEAFDAVTNRRLVLPLHIDLVETTTFSPAEASTTPDRYTVNVPDPSIFLS